MNINPDDGVYANKKMDSPAPRRHGQSAIKAVDEGGQRKIIKVVFIASESSDTGQWIPVEIHRINKERGKAIRRAMYRQNPLLLRKKIRERRVSFEDFLEHPDLISPCWWRGQ